VWLLWSYIICVWVDGLVASIMPRHSRRIMIAPSCVAGRFWPSQNF
jgi:hypothetical protein